MESQFRRVHVAVRWVSTERMAKGQRIDWVREVLRRRVVVVER